MFKRAETSRNLCAFTIKAMLGLFLVFTIFPSFAEHPMIAQLIREKQQKMEKLESCKGTTKNLKIAGISTLGLTAVGVGANIAEAVVLDKTKDKVEDAKKARDVQLQIKEERIKREEEERARQEQQMRLQMAMAMNNQQGAAKTANVAGSQPGAKPGTQTGAQSDAKPTVQVAGNSVTISTEWEVDDKTMALRTARAYLADEQNGIKGVALSEQLCNDSYPATLTCKVDDKDYVFYFDLKELPEYVFENPQVTKDNVIDAIKNTAEFRGWDTSKCEIKGNTVTCRKNNFAVQKFRFGYEKAAEAEPERVDEFKHVRLDDIEQVKRLVGPDETNMVSRSAVCRVESAGKGQRQDYVRCEEADGPVKIFEFDNIIKSKNGAGEVEKSLQKYFCGTDNKDLIDAYCAGHVNYVMYGTTTAPKKVEKPAEPQTKIESRYSAVQLNNLDQARRLLGEDSLSADACSSSVRTEKNQDFLKCGDTEYEFDDLTDSNNIEGGRVYTSLQKYFCGNTGKNVENESSCMKKVLRVWGGTITKPAEAEPEVKKEKKAEESKKAGEECTTVLGSGIGVYEETDDGLKCKIEKCRLPGFDINVADGGYSCTGLASKKAAGVQKAKDKQACKDLEPFAVWEGGECKYEGDECTTVLGSGIGVYEETDDGLKCKIERCRLPGFDINVADGGYSCTGLASEKAPKQVEEKPEEPKPVELKNTAKQDCEQGGDGLWVNGECKHFGDRCEVFIGKGWGYYEETSSGLKCRLVSCEADGYVVNEEDRHSCKKINQAADGNSSVYFVGDKMYNIDAGGNSVKVGNFEDVKRQQEENERKADELDAKMEKIFADKAALERQVEREEFEQKMKDAEQLRAMRREWQDELCARAHCSLAECQVERYSGSVVKVHCPGIVEYYDNKANDEYEKVMIDQE